VSARRLARSPTSSKTNAKQLVLRHKSASASTATGDVQAIRLREDCSRGAVDTGGKERDASECTILLSLLLMQHRLYATQPVRGEFVVKRPPGCERAPDNAGAMHIE